MSVPITAGDGHTQYNSAQEAVDAFFLPGTLDADGFCPRCLQNSTTKIQRRRVVDFPQTLLLTFNLWTSGAGIHCLLHTVDPSAGVVIDSEYYAFTSSVLHIGVSRSNGHYAAVASHDTPTPAWWFYNDARRVIATNKQLQGRAMHGN